MDGYTSSGKWKDLNIGSATASIRKYDDSTKIKLTIDTIHKTATVTDSNNVLKDKSVRAYLYAPSNIFPRANIQAKEVSGNFFFKDINTINDGKYASYNDDRIVFYKDDYLGRDFTGYVRLSSSYPSSFELCIDTIT
jgi:hypothetical protein